MPSGEVVDRTILRVSRGLRMENYLGIVRVERYHQMQGLSRPQKVETNLRVQTDPNYNCKTSGIN